MNNGHKLKQYNQSPSLTKGKLVKMYYKLLLTAVDKAKINLEINAYEKASAYLIIAQDCIYELNCALDFSINPEVGKRYRSLYDYLFRLLLETNVRKDPIKLGEVMSISQTMMDLWEQVLSRQDAQVESDLNKGNRLNGVAGQNAIKKRKEIVYKSHLVEKKSILDLKK
jgi:flagellar protein FliS